MTLNNLRYVGRINLSSDLANDTPLIYTVPTGHVFVPCIIESQSRTSSSANTKTSWINVNGSTIVTFNTGSTANVRAVTQISNFYTAGFASGFEWGQNAVSTLSYIGFISGGSEIRCSSGSPASPTGTAPKKIVGDLYQIVNN